MVAAVLVVEWASEHEQARDAVVTERLRPQHFGEPPLASFSVHLHLPETILGLYEALGEEEVVEVGGVDMGHSPGIAENLDFRLQAGDLDAAFDLGQMRLGEVFEARAGCLRRRRTTRTTRPSAVTAASAAGSCWTNPRAWGGYMSLLQVHGRSNFVSGIPT